MTDAPWDEGPVAELRARITELEALRWEEIELARHSIAMLEADRDRAVSAVRELRALLEACSTEVGWRSRRDITAVLAATASYDAKEES